MDTNRKILTNDEYNVKESANFDIRKSNMSDFLENGQRIFLKDIGKIESNNTLENTIKCYRTYEIYLIDENGEMKLKCLRRYRDFYNFYEKLVNSYPYFNLLILPDKNFKTKLNLLPESFYRDREKKLQYFLCYLMNTNTISNSKEFMKFLNEPKFDEEFFSQKSYDILNIDYNQSTISNFLESAKKLVLDYYSGKKRTEKHVVKDIFEEKKYFEEAIEKFSKLKETYIKLLNNYNDQNFLIESNLAFFGRNHDEFDDIFNFMDVALVLKNTHEKFKSNPQDEKIIDSIEIFSLVIKGLVKTIERFGKLLQYRNSLDAEMDKEKDDQKNEILEKKNNNASILQFNFEENLSLEIENLIRNGELFVKELIESILLNIQSKFYI